jgi:hypothetical protein
MGQSEIHASTLLPVITLGLRGLVAWRCGNAWWQGSSHLLQLRSRSHLLGEQSGLDAVEQPLEPADQLGLGDA